MNRSRLFSLFVTLLVAVTAAAAPMQRLVRVVDATTVVVDRDGLQTAITLAAVEVPPWRRAETVAYLETMIGAWVLVENGNVYRSPDGAFLNAELRRRLAADEAPVIELHPMTVLGAVAPGPQRSTAPRAPARQTAVRQPKEERPVKPRRTSPMHRKWHAPK